MHGNGHLTDLMRLAANNELLGSMAGRFTLTQFNGELNSTDRQRYQ